MENCKHMNFEADVQVDRIEDQGRFVAEIHIRAAALPTRSRSNDAG